MKAAIIYISILCFLCTAALAQNPNRVKLRDLQSPPDTTSDFVIFAVNDTAGWKQITEYNGDTVIVWHPTLKKFGFIHKDSLFSLPADNVTGNGTTNYLSRWIAPYTLGTAGISDDGSEIQFARPTVLYGVNTAAPATYGTFGIDNTLGIERPTYYNGSAWIPWLAYSGATNQYSYFSNSNTITSNTQLFRSSTGVEIGDGNYFKLPNATTAGAPTGAQGRTFFNTTFNQPQYHDGTSYRPFGEWYKGSGGAIYFNTGNTYIGTNSPVYAATLAVYKNSTSGADRLLVVNNGTAYPDHSILEIYANRIISFGNLGQLNTLYYNVATSEFNAGLIGFKIRQTSTPYPSTYGITYTNQFGFNGGGIIGAFAPLKSLGTNEFRAFSASLATYQRNTSSAPQGGVSIFFNLSPTTGFYTAAGDMYGFRVGTETNSGFLTQNTNARYYSYGSFQRIEQTGTSSGITRAFWANDNIITAYDYRAFESSNNTGKQLYLAGTANSYINTASIPQCDTCSNMLVINSAGILSKRTASTVYTGFTPAADSGTGSNVASGGTLTISGGFGINTSVSGTAVTLVVDSNEVATQYDLTQIVTEFPDTKILIARTIVDGDGALPDSTVTVNGTFNAGFWRVPESMDGYTLTKASFGIFDKGDMTTSGATYSFGVQKCNGSNMSCSNSSNVNFTPSSETELELSLSITLNANDILRVNYQPPQSCAGGCGTQNVNGLVVTYTIQQN